MKKANYYIFDNGDGLYLMKDSRGHVVDSRYAKDSTDAKNAFLRNHRELKSEDIEYAGRI